MTYSSFLVLFLIVPIVLFSALLRSNLTVKRWRALAALALIALTYTTPWDNYLVANGIWTYDPERVMGVTLGWVPLEEYGFFVLQPFLTGLVLFGLRDRMQSNLSEPSSGTARWSAAGACAGLWLLGTLLIVDAGPGTRYLGLILAWGSIPLGIQMAFGADLLRSAWRPAVTAWIGSSLYLIGADMVAIRQGIWTISPQTILGWNPVQGLVFEEAVFFFVTNALVVGGLSLLDDPRSIARLDLGHNARILRNPNQRTRRKSSR